MTKKEEQVNLFYFTKLKISAAKENGILNQTPPPKKKKEKKRKIKINHPAITV